MRGCDGMSVRTTSVSEFPQVILASTHGMYVNSALIGPVTELVVVERY